MLALEQLRAGGAYNEQWDALGAYGEVLEERDHRVLCQCKAS